MSRIKGIVLNLTLFLGSVLFALILGEVACRVVQPPPRVAFPPGMFELNAGLWRMAPSFKGVMDNGVDFTGAVATADEEGRRIVPAAPAAAPRRLLVLGDSQTFGHGLADEDSWPNRLQQQLSRRGLAVKVVNYAVPAINIDQYERRIERLKDEIGPNDMVLVGVSWNDLITPMAPLAEASKAAGSSAMEVVNGYLVTKRGESAEAMAARVRFYQWSGIVIPPFQGIKEFIDGLAQTSALVGMVYPHAKALYYRARGHSPVRELAEGGVPEGNFVYLAHMRDRIVAKGGTMVVALLPERQFFEDEAYRVYSVGGRDFPTQDYMNYLAEPLCRAFAVRCLNAFPLIHEHQAEGMAFRVDGHFTAKAAALLGPWLADRLYP